jgi:oligopeptide transport system substrate-binding protein
VCGVAALALAAAGCTSGGSNDTSSSNANAAITVDGNEPQNPLVPGNTTESGGIDIQEVLFSRLVHYKTEDAAPEKDMAESIDTKDSKVFTIKIKKGWKFHDGTPVTAKSFVDAWNWTAYGPNGALNTDFFRQIQGYDDVNSVDPDGEGPLKAPAPKAKTMSGLKVVDDTTFEVTLSAPFSIFPLKLGYVGFSPLPAAFFKDPKAFGEHPIGNGPFKFVEWKHKASIKLTRNDNFLGTKPKIKDVTFKLYTDPETSYNDLVSNNLDFLRQVPTSKLIANKFKTDLGTRAFERPLGGITTITAPQYVAKFKNPKLIQAISMAIDRKLITDKIFAGGRTPATGWISPAVDGYKAGGCAEFCTYDPAKAKALLAEAGGFTGDLSLSYNADGPHKPWIEAVCNSIKKAIAVNCVPKPFAQFSDFRTASTTHKQTGLFRTGWSFDYPSIENFLNPLYRTGAGSNDGLYSSPEFDAKMKQADAAPTVAAANKLYAEGEAILAKDFPVIPLWYAKGQGGSSTKLKNVHVKATGDLDLIVVQAK